VRPVLAPALLLFCGAPTGERRDSRRGVALGDDLRPLSERAWALWKDGRMEESLAAFRELLAASRAVGDRKTEASTVNFIGLWYQMMGDLPAARRKCDEALPMARAAGDRNLEGIVLYQLAWLRFMNGDYLGAVRRYEESLALRPAIRHLA